MAYLTPMCAAYAFSNWRTLESGAPPAERRPRLEDVEEFLLLDVVVELRPIGPGAERRSCAPASRRRWRASPCLRRQGRPETPPDPTRIEAAPTAPTVARNSRRFFIGSLHRIVLSHQGKARAAFVNCADSRRSPTHADSIGPVLPCCQCRNDRTVRHHAGCCPGNKKPVVRPPLFLHRPPAPFLGRLFGLVVGRLESVMPPGVAFPVSRHFQPRSSWIPLLI